MPSLSISRTGLTLVERCLSGVDGPAASPSQRWVKYAGSFLSAISHPALPYRDPPDANYAPASCLSTA